MSIPFVVVSLISAFPRLPSHTPHFPDAVGLVEVLSPLGEASP